MKSGMTTAALWLTLLAPSQPTPTLAPHQQLAHDIYKELIEINTTDSVGSSPATAI